MEQGGAPTRHLLDESQQAPRPDGGRIRRRFLCPFAETHIGGVGIAEHHNADPKR